MTAGLFAGSVLRLEYRDRFELVDADTGGRLAGLDEVVRVRAPRGHPIFPTPVQNSRLTFALVGADGAAQLYLDRAQQVEMKHVSPQTALVAPDGAVLCRLDHDRPSPVSGGGEADGRDVPTVRLLGADDRPLGGIFIDTSVDVDVQMSPDGRDVRPARWVNAEGAVVAERRDGVLHLAEGLSHPWRAMVIGSYIALALEIGLLFGKANGKGKAKPPKHVPEVFPGHAELHRAYDAYQHRWWAEYRRAVRGPRVFAHRPGVRSYYVLHLYKIGLPILLVIALIRWILLQ